MVSLNQRTIPKLVEEEIEQFKQERVDDHSHGRPEWAVSSGRVDANPLEFNMREQRYASIPRLKPVC